MATAPTTNRGNVWVISAKSNQVGIFPPSWQSNRSSPIQQGRTTAGTFPKRDEETATPTDMSPLVEVSGTGTQPWLKLSLVILAVTSTLGCIALAATVAVVFTTDQIDIRRSAESGIESTTLSNSEQGLDGDSATNIDIISCSQGQFECNDGSCIPDTYMCDIYLDCGQGEDESNCECDSMSMSTCSNGDCIYNAWICDSENDCGDNSDEANCTCETGFSCTDTSKCLDSLDKVCDGIPHCGDNSDELNCNCSSLQRACSDGTCILASWWCDGTTDCNDGGDENDTLCGIVCDSTTQFECFDHRQCIADSQTCDGIPQCGDGSDERLCTVNLGNTDAIAVIMNGVILPVCSTNWNISWNNIACMEMGLGYAVTNGVTEDSAFAESGNGYALVQAGIASESISEVLTYSADCPAGKVLTLTCSYNECGTRAKQFQQLDMVARILHGYDAQIGNWPWQVGLEYRGVLKCGGSLIQPNWLITAAHCVTKDYLGAYKYTVRLGTAKAYDNSVSTMQTATASSIFMHPNYNDQTLENDVALIKLTSDVTYTDYVKPICLPSFSEQDFSSHLECYTSGWGGVDAKASIYPENLQEAKMSLINDSVCEKDPDIAYWGLYNDVMQCAGYEHGYITVCNGDSGGPLVCKDARNVWTLVGVVSWGPVQPGISCMGISVFTEVASYTDWIEQTLNSG